MNRFNRLRVSYFGIAKVKPFKFYLLVICILIKMFGSAQGWKPVYIEPSNAWKIDLTENSPAPTLALPYLQMKAMRNIYPNHPLASSGGINIGYRFKNADLLQIGVMYDDSQQGFRYVSTEQNQVYNRIDQNWGSYRSGPLFTNISFLYKRNFMYITSRYLNPDRFIRVHLIIGLSYFYRPNSRYELMDNYGTSFTAPDSSIYTLTAEQYNIPQSFRYSLKGNLGIDITFGKGSKEWFTLGASLRYGRQNYLSDIGATVEIVKNNSKQTYGALYRGTGNGIYFTLSKRFYPFEYLHNRQEKKKQKYLEEHKKPEN